MEVVVVVGLRWHILIGHQALLEAFPETVVAEEEADWRAVLVKS